MAVLIPGIKSTLGSCRGKWGATLRTKAKNSQYQILQMLEKVAFGISENTSPSYDYEMGVIKKTRKFAQVGCLSCIQRSRLKNSLQVKRVIGQRDARLKKNQDKAVIESKRKPKDEIVREMSVPLIPSNFLL